MRTRTLFALDFDGVICDSATETAMTAWKAAQGIWPDMYDQAISDKQLQQFRKIRPSLEFGYEAILIIRLLHQGVSASELFENYYLQLQSLIKSDDLCVDVLKDSFGQTRDNEIKRDEAAWIASNPVFEGITVKLKTLEHDDWTIITTKQERFVKRILQGNDIQLDESRIYGLDRKLNKQEILKHIKASNPDRPITFIEDRLPTLFSVLEDPDLRGIKVQLVDWGYNTEVERNVAHKSEVEVIGKADFLRVL